MNLFQTLGTELITRLDALNKTKQLIAVNAEPEGARLILVTGESMLLEGMDKDATTRLFLYLGFVGTGQDGLETPAFPPHLKIN